MNAIIAWWKGLSTAARRGVVGGVLGVLALLVAGAVVLSGGSEPDEVAATTTTEPTPSTTIVPTTTEPDTGPRAPLTGLRVEDPVVLFRPALAVKIDNLDAPSETALPQAGLLDADIVFEELVESDITRLVGVFHSQQPGRVGPVRSARFTDVELLPQLGQPILAWSGGNAAVAGAVRSSPDIIDLGVDRATASYTRDRSRRAPHNLYVQANELFTLAPDDAGFPPSLFQFRRSGEPNPDSAQPSQGVDIRWGGGSASSPVSWRWEPDLRIYIRSQSGRVHTDESGTPLSAKNIVVMVTDYGPNANAPVGRTVGSGELFVFTNGRVIHGRWDRNELNRPAILRDDEGNPVKLSPGQTWIELPRTGSTTAVPG